MSIQAFAGLLGGFFLVIGLAGIIIPGFVTAPMEHLEHLAVTAGAGRLLGLFPVNILHNLVHVVTGILGLAATGSTAASTLFARTLAGFYGALTILGFIPGLDTTFGLIPLYGHDIWLHGVIAILAAYFGWAPAAARTRTAHRGSSQNPTFTGHR